MKLIINERQVKYVIDNIINEQQQPTIFKFPGDYKWEYTVTNGKWYAKRVDWAPGKWARLSDNLKYQSSVEKLDKQFPNARPNTQVAGIPTKNVGTINNQPDFNTELPTPGFKDPNRFIRK